MLVVVQCGVHSVGVVQCGVHSVGVVQCGVHSVGVVQCSVHSVGVVQCGVQCGCGAVWCAQCGCGAVWCGVHSVGVVQCGVHSVGVVQVMSGVVSLVWHGVMRCRGMSYVVHLFQLLQNQKRQSELHEITFSRSREWLKDFRAATVRVREWA